MAQRLIPGVGFVDDAGLDGQYLIPGVGFAEFEAAGGGGATATTAPPSITLTAPAASASGTANVIASGVLSTISLSAPTATATGTTAGNADATGALAALSLTAPSATASGTSGATHGSASGAAPAISLSAPAGSAVGTTGGSGTIVTPVLKNNTGAVLANETGVIVNVYDATTGELIVKKTGQTSSSIGVVTVVDALIAPDTEYAYEVILASGARRLPTKVAA